MCCNNSPLGARQRRAPRGKQLELWGPKANLLAGNRACLMRGQRGPEPGRALAERSQDLAPAVWDCPEGRGAWLRVITRPFGTWLCRSLTACQRRAWRDSAKYLSTYMKYAG